MSTPEIWGSIAQLEEIAAPLLTQRCQQGGFILSAVRIPHFT